MILFKSRKVEIEKISSKCVNMLLSHQISGHKCQGLFVLTSGTSKCLIIALIELPILLSFVKETCVK